MIACVVMSSQINLTVEEARKLTDILKDWDATDDRFAQELRQKLLDNIETLELVFNATRGY